MLQYQLRAVEEKAQLDGRLAGLTTFLESPQIDNVAPVEQVRLLEQQRVMRLYAEILGKRIQGWAG